MAHSTYVQLDSETMKRLGRMQAELVRSVDQVAELLAEHLGRPAEQPGGVVSAVSQPLRADQPPYELFTVDAHPSKPALFVARDGNNRVVAMWDCRVYGDVLYCANADCLAETFRMTSRRFPEPSNRCPSCAEPGVPGGKA